MIYGFRHGIVEEPYLDDYDKVSFLENSLLHSGQVNPGIDKEKTFKVLQESIRNTSLGHIKRIFLSSQKRAIETSELVSQILGGNIDIIPMEDLVEIKYDPRQYMTEGEYKKYGGGFIREMVLSDIISKSGNIESIDSIHNKISTFLNHIGSDRDFLFVSHAILLKFIDFFLNHGNTLSGITDDKVISHSLNLPKGGILKINI